MKLFSSLPLFLVLSIASVAQNNMFIPFGQTPEEVMSFLGSRDYIINIHEDMDMKSVRAVLDQNKHVEYAFNEGSLFATTITRNYKDRKIAKSIQKDCLNYMEYVSKGNTRQTANEEIICYTALTDARVIKLFIQEHKESVTVTLSSVSRKFSPPMQQDELYYEDALLQKSFISN